MENKKAKEDIRKRNDETYREIIFMTHIFHFDIIKVSTNQFFSRGHWGKRTKLKDDYRKLIRACNLQFKVKNPCKIEFSFYFKGRLLDCDNNSSMGKFITDALVKEGILIDDTPDYVYQVTYRSSKDKKDYVVVRIEEDA